ncbi:MAG: YybH family protein [Terracidiphilus sp.]
MSTATWNASARPNRTDEVRILALIGAMSTALYDKNAAGFAAAYARDAALYTLAPPMVHRGVDLGEKQAWFDTWESPIGLEPRDFTVTVSGDLAFAHGYMRLSGKKRRVEQPISFWMRETLCLERQNGEWRIVHEHASVPFYMDGNLRPAFDLQP